MGVERAWVFLLIPVGLALIFLWRRKSFLVFPSLGPVPGDWVGRVASFSSRTLPIMLFLLLLLLAAGPRFPGKERMKYGYGADIVFILDESVSMAGSIQAGPGYAPPVKSEEQSKFSVAKSNIAKFMERRRAGKDRYGLTVFGSTAVRVLPLTFDHSLFLSSLEAQECILSLTMIYHALALGLDELMRSEARSRVLIFVSDGSGVLEDETYGFSRIIREQGIRFYWISLGYESLDDLLQFLDKIGPLGKRIDAGNEQQLEEAFSEIHNMERSLILYRSTDPALSSRFIVYSGFVLMVLVWVLDSLFVYNRRT